MPAVERGRSTRMTRIHTRVALAMAVIMVASVSCKSSTNSEQWSFFLSRQYLEQIEHEGTAMFQDIAAPNEDPRDDQVAAILIVLPFAVDIAVLPITAVHDWLFMGD